MSRDTRTLRVVLGSLVLGLALVIALLPDTLIDRNLAVTGVLMIALSAFLFIANLKFSPIVFGFGLVPTWLGIVQRLPSLDSLLTSPASCDGCREVGYIAGSVVILLYGTALVLGALACAGLLAGMIATINKSAKLCRNYEGPDDA